MWIAAIVATVLVIIPVAWYNNFIKLRFLVKEADSGVDVQLKRRHDLIPNIVQAVKGYMQYEQKLLLDITALRSALDASPGAQEKQSLENSLSQGLKSVFALAENYPQLKADQQFLRLHKSLVEVEDQLQMSRRYYNGTVRNYNIAVESFPASVLAALLRFKPAEFFEIEYATERETPDVKF